MKHDASVHSHQNTLQFLRCQLKSYKKESGKKSTTKSRKICDSEKKFAFMTLRAVQLTRCAFFCAITTAIPVDNKSLMTKINGNCHRENIA